MSTNRLLERFLRYVAVDTTARDEAGTYPSSPGQLELGRILVDELKAFALFVLTKTQPYMAVLTATTRLTNKFTFGFNSIFADGFTISNLWLANIGFNSKFTLHAINHDFKMKFKV